MDTTGFGTLTGLANLLKGGGTGPPADAGTAKIPLSVLPVGVQPGQRVSLTVTGIDSVTGMLGAFVKFNYGAQTKVNITVYNALGQVLSTNANQSVSNDKIYLNVDNAKDQLIFVSVGNIEKNTQVTKKLFNN